jgi:hypothetical protein
VNQRRHSRRRFLQTAGTGLAAAALPSWLTKCRTAEKPPNILFIVIDDLNDWANCLGGRPGVHTPNLGRLLDTFESSRYGRNTIIVLWSDHGMHTERKSTGRSSPSGRNLPECLSFSLPRASRGREVSVTSR